MTSNRTDRDRLDDRLAELEDSFADEAASVKTATKQERKAVRAALGHRYVPGSDPVGNPLGNADERRSFLTDAVDHLDEADATVLRDMFREAADD